MAGKITNTLHLMKSRAKVKGSFRECCEWRWWWKCSVVGTFATCTAKRHTKSSFFIHSSVALERTSALLRVFIYLFILIMSPLQLPRVKTVKKQTLIHATHVQKGAYTSKGDNIKSRSNIAIFRWEKQNKNKSHAHTDAQPSCPPTMLHTRGQLSQQSKQHILSAQWWNCKNKGKSDIFGKFILTINH